MNTFTQKITQLEADAVKNILRAEGAAFDVVKYSIWRAKTSAFQATCYTSGKLLIQGKDITPVIKKLSPIFGNTCITGEDNEKANNRALIETNGESHIGTDESGKGDFFGPLVAAGVLVNNETATKFLQAGIKDSKKLDDEKIIKLANLIKANSLHSVIVITPVKYNELYAKFNNLNKLLAWAHARAIENILEKESCKYALADKFGDESLIKNALMNKGKTITLKQAVRAEADIAVAAASVLARAEFVKRMSDMEKRYELTFSKGASEKVKCQAQKFIEVYSKDRLNEVAKMHFKTAAELNV